jgi:TusA-related sulfurtransferase
MAVKYPWEGGMADIKADAVVDARGLVCPLTVLKTKKAMDAMEPGQVLEVLINDLRAKADIVGYLRRAGNRVFSSTEEGQTVHLYIRKK